MSVTDGQRAILRATLGLYTSPDPSHNGYYPTSPMDRADCEAMMAAGLMRKSPTEHYCYQATVAGIRAVWGRAAIYTPTGDEVTARETGKKIRILWTEPDKGRFRTGEVYRVGKSTVRWL